MKFTDFSFGKLRVDGDEYDHDLVIDRGELRKRHKGPSKKYRSLYGHTPLSLEEDIPWKCKRLVVGTGMLGRLPVTDEVKAEAHQRGAELVRVPRPRRFRCSGTTRTTATPSCTSPAESTRLATQRLPPPDPTRS